MRTPAGRALVVSIGAPKDRQDSVLRAGVAPIVEALVQSADLEAISFERFNKPDWGIRLHVLGARAWLDGVARPEVGRRLEAADVPFSIVEDDAEDKWIGGSDDYEILKRIHHADTAASLRLIEAEASGALSTSRAQWSLLIVEGLLELFEFDAERRLEFYRRGWEWAPALGRWDAEVYAALERKYEGQKEPLHQALFPKNGRVSRDAWGGPEPERIALELLESSREPIREIGAAASVGSCAKTAIDLAVLIGHAHSNRLGIHATQEATIRYLVWRARGGRTQLGEPDPARSA